MAALRVPSATYRLQFSRQFRFKDAQALVPYLQALGITDLYASPLLEAGRGSAHGYDVTNPARLNPELGGEEDFAALAGTLRQKGLGLLLDIVPNHMAASSENPWWRDVLRNGPGSAYAAYFDVDWRPARPGLAGKVLLPVLDEHYGKVLENGELALTPGEDGFWVHYREQRLPLSPAASARVLEQLFEKQGCLPGAILTAAEPFLDLLGTLKNLHKGGEKEKFLSTFHKAWKNFWDLCNYSPAVKAFVKEKLQSINGRKGDSESFNFLDRVLAEQFFRLACWRTANEEINYRRFFAVSDLVSLRVEEKDVFEATHALIFRLARAGQITGLRVDHVDGLRDPHEYLCRLQKRLPGERQNKKPGFYVVVEKILGEGEDLPTGWPVYGTTGYDFMNVLSGLFVDGSGTRSLDAIYAQAGRPEEDFATVAYKQKKRVLKELFAGDMRSLARQLGHLAEEDRHGRDLTLAELEQALVEVTACLPVYRTYTREFLVSEQDRRFIERAVSETSERHPGCRPACSFLRRVLLLEFPDYLPEEQRRAWLDFVMRWQQFSGPAMAKGFEDTALYVYNRLVSLNEVGGNPASCGTPAAEFHRFNMARLERSPHAISATSTHDTKRSEDVRARINVLSEIPGAWARRVDQWRRWNRSRKPVVDGRPVPGDNMEYFIYQTLVGAWPLHEEEIPSFKERLQAYLLKAAREAKGHTSWIRPDAGYEGALKKFTASILEPGDENVFLKDFLEFQRSIACYGALNSLSQVLLKITSPGVPDFYQGTELWNFSLVDPDNRRPVDFGKAAGILAGLKIACLKNEENVPGQAELAKSLFSRWEDGRVKLYLIYKALNFRREHQKLFAAGGYVPVGARGNAQEHVCAFARRKGSQWALAATPRLAARLHMDVMGPGAGGEPPALNTATWGAAWAGTSLALPEEAPGRWRNVLTGEIITAGVAAAASPAHSKILPLHRVFKNFPVALLAGEQRPRLF